MNVEILRSTMSDNYFFLIADEQGRAALIDPIDGEQAVEFVKRHGYELKLLLNTHFHPDHVGGNQTVLQAFPEARVIAGSGDAPVIDQQFGGAGQRGVDETVSGGDEVQLGQVILEVIDTPGHTPGHISFRVEHHLFSGDTIFVGGAGNCRFGGDPAILFETFRDVLRELPPETVFYPGHDYAVRNAQFLLSIEAEHPETMSVLEEAKAAADDERLMQTTLGRERTYNAFMRFDDPKLKEALAASFGEQLQASRELSDSEEEAVFRCVRSLRNNW